MIRLMILVFGLALLGCAGADDKLAKGPKVVKAVPEPYQGFKADQALLRKLEIHKAKDGGKDTRASSGEACQAASRIFSRVSFLFRTRAEVLEFLGDPATVSDYGQPAGKDPSSPLVYFFGTGFGGWKYTISFDNGVSPSVDQVRVDSVD